MAPMLGAIKDRKGYLDVDLCHHMPKIESIKLRLGPPLMQARAWHGSLVAVLARITPFQSRQIKGILEISDKRKHGFSTSPLSFAG